MYEIIEVRLKAIGIPWSELVNHVPAVIVDLEEVAAALELAPTSAILKSLAIAFTAGIAAAEGVEVRWNISGSLQGHYTGG